MAARTAGLADGQKPRTMLAVGAAAAILLLGGVGYGLTAAFTGSGQLNGNGRPATLTKITGCDGLDAVRGTLEQVAGTSLVIKAASGQPVTVTASAATQITVSGARLSDVTDGASVTVFGRGSNGTIAATGISIAVPRPFEGGRIMTPTGIVAVEGTAADVGPGGLIVVTSAGTRVPVATSSETEVNVFRASPSQLQTGISIIAIGHSGQGGTLAAIGVVQPAFPLELKGCSASSVTTAITTALIAAG